MGTSTYSACMFAPAAERTLCATPGCRKRQSTISPLRPLRLLSASDGAAVESPPPHCKVATKIFAKCPARADAAQVRNL